MKCLVVVSIAIFLAVLQVATASYKDNIQNYIKDCIESSGVDAKLVKNARDNGEFVDDVKLEDYFYCVARKLNFISENGDFQPDNVKAVVPENVDKDKAYEIIDDCVKNTGTRKEQTAFLAYKCYKEHGFTIA